MQTLISPWNSISYTFGQKANTFIHTTISHISAISSHSGYAQVCHNSSGPAKGKSNPHHSIIASWHLETQLRKYLDFPWRVLFKQLGSHIPMQRDCPSKPYKNRVPTYPKCALLRVPIIEFTPASSFWVLFHMKCWSFIPFPFFSIHTCAHMDWVTISPATKPLSVSTSPLCS